MPSQRLPRVLAASFVVTMASTPGLSGCKKEKVGKPTPPPEGEQSASVYRNGNGTCAMALPEPPCPEGASCNPPAPTEVDCPVNLWDAGESIALRSPPGKESWIRVKPILWPASDGMCSYTPERFCAPPGKRFECTRSDGPVEVACAKLDDAGARAAYRIASFVFRDAEGNCRKSPPADCRPGPGCEIPDGEIVPCP